MNKQLLPIGSVVQLKDATARVMVMGYLAVGASRPDYIWDYSGIKFPIGLMDANEIYQFNHEQVEMIYALGYQDMEQFIFADRLEKKYDELKPENNQS